jgi:outer membrane protein assembly factor BamB
MTHLVRLAALALCLLPLSAADPAWPADHAGAKPPAGWEAMTGEGASLSFEQGRLSLTGPVTRHALVSRDLALDGSDAAPLVVTAMASGSPRELGGLPTAISLWWDAGHAVSIGVGGVNENVERWEPTRRRGWAHWIVDGKGDRRHTEQALYSGESPAHLRLVLTSNDLSAAISADGVTWQTLISLPRAGTLLAKAPARLVAGRGSFGDDPATRRPLLANDGRDVGWNEPVTTSISRLAITTAAPALPRARLVPKATGFEDLRAAELTASTVALWHLLGPLPASDKPYGPESARDTTNGLPLVAGHDLGWKPHAGASDAERRSLNLKALLKLEREHQVVFAATTITCDAPRLERLWFDGARGVAVSLNGRPVAEKRTSWESDITPDRFAATVQLAAGENLVVLRLSTGHEGQCRLVFRHEPAAPEARIADLTQAIAAFGADNDGGVAAHLEIARWWEVLGQRRLATEELARGLARDGLSGAQVDSLSFARARLHGELRDRTAVVSDIEELARRRLMGDAGDRPATRLNLVRLWEDMGFPERALAAASELLASKDLDPATLAEVGLELARLHQVQGKADLVPADLRALATRLPANDPLRFELLLAAAARDRDLAAALAEAGRDRGRLARVHTLGASLAEAAGDAPARIAALRQVIANRDGESSWESLQGELAEALAAAGDAAGAAAAYRQALQRAAAASHPAVVAAMKDAGDGAAALGALRTAAARAALVESPAGETLLQEALKAPPAPVSDGEPLSGPVITDWHVIGPFPNPDFAAYAKPPVDAAKVDLKGNIQGKRWSRPGRDAYHDGILDLATLLQGNDCVAFAYRTIAVPLAGEGELAIGADDGLVVWFNGKKIHEDRDSRGVIPGQIRLPVRFKAGSNSVLCMVQNGNGDWGLHLRVNGAATGSRGLAEILARIARPDARNGIANILGELVSSAVATERIDDGLALVRLATRVLGDQPAAQVALAEQLLVERRDQPRLLRDPSALVRWLAAAGERRSWPERAPWAAAFPVRAASLLLAGGDAAGAATVLERHLAMTLESDPRRDATMAQAELHRLAGYPLAAAELYRQLAERPDSDQEARRRLQDGMQRVRGARAEGAAFTPSLDAATLLSTGDRALAAGDTTRAIRSWQRAIDQHGDALLKGENGVLVGVAALIGERLRGLDAAGLAAYRKLADRRADEALALAGSDVFALGRIAAAYPATGAAGQALARIADLSLDAGHGGLAAAVLARLSAGDDRKAAAQLAARRAYALELAGDHDAAGEALTRLLADHAGAMLDVGGSPRPLAEFVAARRAALAKRTGGGQWPTAGGSPARTGANPGAPRATGLLSETMLPVPLDQRIAHHRFAPSPYHHLALQPAVVDGVAYLHTGDETFAIAIDDGALRWRAGTSSPGRTTAAFAGNVDGTTSVADGVVLVRARHAGGQVIEARDAATGALRWATSTTLGAANAISPPAVADGLVVALFNDRAERFRNTLAAFSLADGSLRWRTSLADGVGNLVASTQQEIPLGDHIAAPAIAGGDVYLATDMGGVVCVDALTGQVRWAATYPRARLDPQGSAPLIRRLANRAPRVVVGGDSIYLAPRDTLALLAIRRSDGALRWHQPFSDTAALIGLAGDALYVQGDGVACLAAADGRERWRWSPGDGTTLHGLAGLTPERILVADDRALVELAREDGRVLERKAWSALSLSAPVGNFIALGERLLAVGDDRLVLLGASQGAAKRQVLPAPGGPTLNSSGLPDAPFAPPLAPRWQFDAAGTSGVFDLAGVLHLDLGDRLVRLAPRGDAIQWTAPSAGDLERLLSAGKLLLALHQRCVVARDQADGRLVWSHPLLIDDCGFVLSVDEERIRERRRANTLVAADDALVVLRPAGGGIVTVLDAARGTQRARLALAGTIHACEVVGGRLVSVTQVAEKLMIDVRSAEGVVIGGVELPLPNREVRKIATLVDAGRGTLVVASHRMLAAIDLAKPAVRWSVPLEIGEPPTLSLAGGRIAVLGRRDGQQWLLQMVDPADGKVAGTCEVQRGDDRLDEVRRPLFAGDRWLSFSHKREGDRWLVVARNLAKPDQEVWSTDLGERHRRRLCGRAVMGASLVVVTCDDWGARFQWTTLDLANGRVTGTGTVAGIAPAEDEEEPDIAAAGNLLLCAGGKGVVALGGLPPAAPGQDALLAAITRLRADPQAGEGADALIAAYAPPVAPALAAERSPRTDGQLDDWSGAPGIVLDRRTQVRQLAGRSWDGPGDLAARARVMWDANAVHLAVEIDDDRFDAAAPGATLDDGDSLVVGIDPGLGRDDGDRQPLVLALALVDGRTQLVQLQGRTVLEEHDAEAPASSDDGVRLAARAVRRAGGWSAELAIPWSALRTNPQERPGWRTDLGLGLAVMDRDGPRLQAIEWGAGLVRSISARRFGTAKCIDLTGQRIAGFRRFIDLLGDHPYAWRFTRRIAATSMGAGGLPQRIAEIEGFIRAQPKSSSISAALAELLRLRRRAGDVDPEAKVASFANAAKVPPRTLGDGIGPGPATGGQGRALRQWVWLDRERPPLELMLQVRTKGTDWHQRALWGQDLLQWGEPETSQRWPMGALPPTGTWVALTIPIAALALDGQEIDNLAFSVHGGDVRWGASEFLDGSQVTVLVDPAKPPRFDREAKVETVGGRPAHGRGPQGGEATHRLAENGTIAIDLRSKSEPPAPDRARMERFAEAARLVPREDEANELLSWSEGLCTGEGEERERQLLAHYQGFLAANPTTPQAGRVLSHLRTILEGWTDGRDPARRAKAVGAIEAMMEAAKLPRSARRQFYAGFSPLIGEWTAIGFFDAGRGAANLGEVTAVERGALDLAAIHAVGDGLMLKWQPLSVDSKLVSPAKQLSGRGARDQTRWPVAYLATRIEVPAAGEAVLYLGLRGRAQVWLNGKRVGGILGGDGELRRDALALPCKLQQGINELLVKVCEREGQPQLTARFGDLAGKPVPGVIPRLPPGVVRAIAEEATRVALQFSAALDPESAGDLANYVLDRDARVTAVVVTKDLRGVVLTTTPLVGTNDYTLAIGKVASASGTPVAAGTRAVLRPPGGDGRGLRAEFFSGRDLRERLASRTDAVVDFVWDDGEQPDPAVPAENFSVRWTGQVRVPGNGRWTFSVVSDDGARLWVNGKPIVDQWVDQGATEAGGSIELKTGKPVDLRLEYFQGGSGKQVQLYWEGPGQAKAIVPAEHLTPAK